MPAFAILLVLLAGALAYSILTIIAARRYRAARLAALAAPPEAISILKPLAGLDLDLESNLRTFFQQDYADFEILFAVRSGDDPAVLAVEKLQREYPHVAARLLITGEPPYANAKVYSLARMLAEAEH